jgi:glucose-6-phosphate 1-dehydrogenase
MIPADHLIVLFGATGDLARRKLLPGLFRLDQAGLMPERYRIVGTSRAPLDHDGFRRFAREALDEFGRSPNGEWDVFARKLSYSDADEEAPALAATIDLPSASWAASRGDCTTCRSRRSRRRGSSRPCGAPASPSARA